VTSAALWVALALSAGAGGPEKVSFLGPKPPAAPMRIVTLAPSLTECVLALGAGGRLVGVSRFDELPEVARLPRVGGFVDPSVEAVLALKPDLVVVQPAPGNERPVEKMAELGAPVLALPLHTIDQVEEGLRELGRALGAAERGRALASELETARARVRQRARAPGERHPKVLFVYGFEPLVVAGPGSFADELLSDAGGINAAAEATAPYPVWSAEAAVRARPDLVVDAADSTAGKQALEGLAGLRDARWVKLPNQDLMHPGPRLAQGIEQLYVLLHGGVDGGR
jgi:iron complex transport system substrate-binding protein